MSDSPNENPFQSPAVDNAQSTSEDPVDAPMPSVVGIICMLFELVAILHFGAMLIGRNPAQGLIGGLSCMFGFVALFRSPISLMICLNYAALMALVSAGIMVFGFLDESLLVIVGIPPMLMYVVIVILLLHAAGGYYLRRI